MMIFLSVSDGLQLVIHAFSGILVVFNLEINLTVNMVGEGWEERLLRTFVGDRLHRNDFLECNDLSTNCTGNQ
jgi:hypothetical protein